MLFWKVMYYLLVFFVFEMMVFWFLISYDIMLEMIGMVKQEEESYQFWYFAVTMAHAILFDAMTFFKFQDIIICVFFFCSARIWAALMQLHMCNAKEFVVSIFIHGIVLILV